MQYANLNIYLAKDKGDIKSCCWVHRNLKDLKQDKSELNHSWVIPVSCLAFYGHCLCLKPFMVRWYVGCMGGWMDPTDLPNLS